MLLLKLWPTPVTLTAAPEMCVFNTHPVMIIIPVQYIQNLWYQVLHLDIASQCRDFRLVKNLLKGVFWSCGSFCPN